MVNAEGELDSEDSSGNVSARPVSSHLQIDTPVLTVGVLQRIKKVIIKTTRSAVVKRFHILNVQPLPVCRDVHAHARADMRTGVCAYTRSYT